MSLPRYPPWWQGTIGLSTGEAGDASDPAVERSFPERTLTVAAENSPVPVVYGTVLIGGMIVKAGLSGNDLQVEYALCLGPATLDHICIGGQTYTIGVELNGITVTSFDGGAPGSTYSGTYDGEDYGVAYVVVRVRNTAEIPTPIFRISANTSNPAESLKRFIESRITGYGKTVEATEAVAYCNELVNGKPRRRANVALVSAESVESRIEILRAYAGCDVNMAGDTVILVPRKVTGGATVRDVGAGDIVEGSASMTQPATEDTPNHVIVSWQALDESEDCPVLRTVTESAEWDDGSGERRTQSLSFPFCQDASQAAREALDRVNYYRYNTLTVECDTFDESLASLVGDVVSLDHPLLGVASPRDMRIVAADSISPGRWRLSLETHDDAMYSDVTAPDPTFPDYDFPSQQDPPTPSPTPTSVSMVERLVEIAPCIYDIYLDVSWDAVSHSGPVDYFVTVYEFTQLPELFSGTAQISNQNTLTAIGAFTNTETGDLVLITGMPSPQNNGTWEVTLTGGSDVVTLEDAVRVDETVTASNYSGAVDVTDGETIVAVGAFATASVGQGITLSNMGVPGNNGDFTITAVTSDDSITVTPASLSVESDPSADIDLKGADIVILSPDEVVYEGRISSTSVSVGPVKPLTNYLAVVIVEADGLRPSTPAETQLTTSDDSLVVADVTGFSGNAVCDAIASLSWNEVTVCALGYEIRWGASGVTWEAANFLARVDALAYTHAPVAGTYDYLIKAFTATYERDRVEYSLNAASVALTIAVCAGGGGDLEDRVTAIESCLAQEGLCDYGITCYPLDHSFELGSVGSSTPWFESLWGDGYTDPPAQDGTYSIGRDISSDRGFNIKQIFPVDYASLTTVTLTAWLYDNDVTTHNVLFTMVYFDDTGNRTSSETYQKASTVGAWGQISQDFDIPAGTKMISLEIAVNPSADTSVFIDNIVITPCISLPASCCPILLNPGFEESAFPSRWRTSGAQINEVIFRSGIRSLVMDGATHYAHQTIPLCEQSADIDIDFTFWIYKDSGIQPDYGVRFYWYDGNLTQIGNRNYVDRTLTANAIWTTYTLTAQNVPPEARYFRIQVEMASSGTGLYWDDFSLSCSPSP